MAGVKGDLKEGPQSTNIASNVPEAPRLSQSMDEDHNPLQPLKKYDTRWKQQRNYAIRQRYTVFRIFTFSTLVGIILLMISVAVFNIKELYPPVIEHDYTNCKDNVTGLECFASVSKPIRPALLSNISCKCIVPLQIDNENLIKMKRILLYYELDNFFQNSRVYKKDVDWFQMQGKLFEGDNPVEPSHCFNPKGENGLYTFPCGKIANSYFSDDFRIFEESTRKELTLDHTGIAWSSDKKRRFKNAKEWENLTNYFTLPKDWHNEQKALFLNGSNTTKRGVESENFIVWMRTAALKNFQKRYAFIEGLKNGNYTVEIDYRYEVKSFQGRKRFVIAADYGSKPRNDVFFIGFGIVGIVCLLMGPFLYFADCAFKQCYTYHLERKSKKRSSEEGDSNIKNVTEAENTSLTLNKDSSSPVIPMTNNSISREPPERKSLTR